VARLEEFLGAPLAYYLIKNILSLKTSYKLNTYETDTSFKNISAYFKKHLKITHITYT
jgi:hypothetical protein